MWYNTSFVLISWILLMDWLFVFLYYYFWYLITWCEWDTVFRNKYRKIWDRKGYLFILYLWKVWLWEGICSRLRKKFAVDIEGEEEVHRATIFHGNLKAASFLLLPLVISLHSILHEYSSSWLEEQYKIESSDSSMTSAILKWHWLNVLQHSCFLPE